MDLAGVRAGIGAAPPRVVHHPGYVTLLKAVTVETGGAAPPRAAQHPGCVTLLKAVTVGTGGGIGQHFETGSG